MAYIIQDDYSLRCAVTYLTDILNQAIEGTALTTAQARANAESFGMATIKAYLVAQYDIDTEFSKANTDPTRNFQIIAALIDCALYTLHKTINPRDVPEHIEREYESTIKWLNEAKDSKIILALLPPRDKTGVNEMDVHFPETFLSGQVKFVSKPYQEAYIFDTEINPANHNVPGSGANDNRQNAYLVLGILSPGNGYIDGYYNIQLNAVGGTTPQTPIFARVRVSGGQVTNIYYQDGGYGADLSTTLNYTGTMGGTGSGLQVSVLNNWYAN